MDRDRDFNFNFPFSGEISAPPLPPLRNFPPMMIDEPQTTLFSDPTPLLPFPSDNNFSFTTPNNNNYYYYSDSNLLSKIPKLEPFSPHPPSSSASAHRFASNLPALRSFESPSSFDSFFTNLTSASSTNHHHHHNQTLQSVVVPDNVVNINNLIRNINNTPPPPSLPPPGSSGGSNKRKRSQRIGDKYRTLKKLMPWDDKKMDTTSMLGEAYKYVKFLQAQVKALETMPEESAFRCENGSVFGAAPVGMLSRKQMLQVVLESPEAQAMLCSECRCVFSIEQLVRFRELINWW